MAIRIPSAARSVTASSHCALRVRHSNSFPDVSLWQRSQRYLQHLIRTALRELSFALSWAYPSYGRTSTFVHRSICPASTGYPPVVQATETGRSVAYEVFKARQTGRVVEDELHNSCGGPLTFWVLLGSCLAFRASLLRSLSLDDCLARKFNILHRRFHVPSLMSRGDD